ncbi:hypothetical protein SAMN06297251_13128 [Fulvimarina manganoxydans]|uniref:Cellulose biosynthesis protein BcsN n=1 Tax=Fulvimarina manganoxydans TaxID=937218 RepID=A0A1W2ER64_9HYPH|nr:cellulose biosynthesis protein BcsN [Fulvimarina manganoxydans]SMD12193.1 hypothetical protein SAMN06297251_13128 [Fulvimarina manganoxydans]
MMQRFGNQMVSRFWPLIGLVLGTLASSGCTRSTTASDVLAFSEPSLRVSTSESVGERRRWAELPSGAGRILDVIETRQPSIATQRIVLSGEGSFSGENLIRLETGGPKGTSPRLLRPPRREEIVAELTEAGLDRPVVIADEPSANAYGPFGYAFRKESGGNCVYAWQWLDLREVEGLSSGFGIRKQPMNIRIRLCQTRSVNAILASIRDLRLLGSNGTTATAWRQGGPGGDALTIANRAMGVARADYADPLPAEETKPSASSRAKAPRASRVKRPASTASKPQRTAETAVESGPQIPTPSDMEQGRSIDASSQASDDPKPVAQTKIETPELPARSSNEIPFIPLPPAGT